MLLGALVALMHRWRRRDRRCSLSPHRTRVAGARALSFGGFGLRSGDGLERQPRAGRLPRRGARAPRRAASRALPHARRQLGAGPPLARFRGAPGGAGLDRRTRRAQLVRAPLAGGVRRRRPLHLGADDPPRGDGNGARACRGRGRPTGAGRGAVWPDDHPRRHRGAEARAPAADGERRTPDALRAVGAGRRLRPRLAADARRARRRRVRGERPEDLDLERPPRRLPLGAGTDGPRRAQAPRDQRTADPHRPRRGGAATAHQHGLGARLQRDLL